MMDVQKGAVVFECDGCDDVLETGESNFNDAQLARRAAGWSTRSTPKNDWEHFCTKCRKLK